MPSPRDNALPPEAAEQIRILSAKLDRITDEIAARAAAVAVPSKLFHYTNSAGLRGVIESGRLRLYDVFGLNDPSEMRHGVKYALNALQGAAAKGHKGAQLFVWRFSERLSAHLEAISRIFVACFSTQGDDLGQWRAYADNGKGFALGFNGPRIEVAFAELPHLTATFAMNYDETLLREASEQIAAEALPVAEFPVGRRYDGVTLSAFLQALSIQISNAILYTAIYFKHPAYELEREYRFQHVRAVGDLDGVVVAGGRSYLEFNWRAQEPTPLTDIVIGPAADQAAARQLAEECLRSAGLDPVQIRTSDIPYRG